MSDTVKIVPKRNGMVAGRVIKNGVAIELPQDVVDALDPSDYDTLAEAGGKKAQGKKSDKAVMSEKNK